MLSGNGAAVTKWANIKQNVKVEKLHFIVDYGGSSQVVQYCDGGEPLVKWNQTRFRPRMIYIRTHAEVASTD